MEIDNVNEILDATLEDRNGSNDIVDEITINNDKITETIVYNSYNYVRRRKCNENVPVCEKKKKRETYRRVSICICLFYFFLFHSTHSYICLYVKLLLF